MSDNAHSSEYFGKERDFYWNSDFLDLLADRLDLATVRSIADIGCGVGHWSAALYSRLAKNAYLVGLDRDPENIRKFRDWTSQLSGGHHCRGLEADATKIPLPDAEFDATTCQTLLLHLAEPLTALREMMRITRPRGLMLCAEPNNMIARYPTAWSMLHSSPDRVARLFEMAWRYTLGRERRGLGKEYLGEPLPGYFADLGLENVRVWLCDKVMAFAPPYATQEEQAYLEALDRWRRDMSGPFDRDQVRENVLAGDGTEKFFDQVWTDFLAEDEAMRCAIGECRWHGAGGGLFYVVAGRKPRQ